MSGPSTRTGTTARSRRWRAPRVVFTALACTVMLAAGCGGASDIQATPGYDGLERQADDSRFNLARPTTTAGPTTMPGDPSRRVETPRPATTDAPVVETTTTTTLPTAPMAPATQSIQDLCGMTTSVASFGTLVADPTIDPHSAIEALLRNMDRYVEVSPPLLSEHVQYIRDAVHQIVAVIRANDFDLQSAEVLDAMGAAANGREPFANLVAVTSQIHQHEVTWCP